MPSKDVETDVSEMRVSVESAQSDPAEDLSEMQDTAMGEEEDEEYELNPAYEMKSETVKYRVIVHDFGCIANETLMIEYFDNFVDADASYEFVSDSDFIKYHDRPNAMLELQKAYRGYGEIFWETVRKCILFDKEDADSSKSK